MNAKGKPENLKPFVKGDKRINRKGKPKDFMALRELAQQIAHEALPGNDTMTVVQGILYKWAGSKDARLQMAFMKTAFGEGAVAVEVNHTGGIEQKHSGEIGIRNINYRTDLSKDEADT